MREIKFRGKSLVEIGEKVIQKGEWITGGITFDADRVWIDTPYIGQVLVNKETVGQYTGLKDKNGKKIYEGDILKVLYNEKCYIVWIEYSEEYAQFVTNSKEILFVNEPLGDNNKADLEVIGNIYEI